jgi:2-amino-4-hydroxy-6-hydroxymethyldihydropteridine diphosphokinase
MRAGIALGSNLGDRLENLRRAWRELQTLPDTSGPFRHSAIYETAPVDTGPEAGAFLNAVAELEYDGHPAVLLEHLQQIEARMGRPSKRPRNASRVIDLDLLYAGNRVLATDQIIVPHPRLHLRRFVLQPLHDLRPELQLPGQERTVAELLSALAEDGESVRLLPGESLS